MKSIEFPMSFVKLIFEFKDIFTKPSFDYFMKVISGLLLGKPKKTITSVIKVHNSYQRFYNFHRFINRYVWDFERLGLTMVQVLIQGLHLHELQLALDDTLVMKYGKCIYGRALHCAHSNKPNMPRYLYGHNWVVLGLLHHISVFKRWFCFPFVAKLFIPNEYVQAPFEFKSRIAIAIDLLKQLKAYTDMPITLVADGLYAKKNLVQYCIEQGIPFISRLRSDAVLHKPVVSDTPATRGRGRPRKYGDRISMKRLSRMNNHFETVSLVLYGKNQSVKTRTFTAFWKPAGTLIKVVIVKFMANKKEITSHFFSTDLHMSTERIITLVAARWSIETAFKDLKEHLGLNDWQVRKEKSVTRSATLNCVALSLLTLWTCQESHNKQLDLWDTIPWYKQKQSICVNNMIQFFKNKCVHVTINTMLSDVPITKQKKKHILNLCNLAA